MEKKQKNILIQVRKYAIGVFFDVTYIIIIWFITCAQK